MMSPVLEKELSHVDIKQKFNSVRGLTEQLVKPLSVEDMCVQPIVDVSPTKWHLAHTTWFFENFILKDFLPGYKVYHKDFCYLFNSYYNSVGDRVMRFERGNMTRPGMDQIMEYRSYVNEHIIKLFNESKDNSWHPLLELGLNHEQQHQELLVTDLKYVLGHNPLFPAYKNEASAYEGSLINLEYLPVTEGIYEIGFSDSKKEFCFDNEKGSHKVFLQGFQIANRLVTNGEFIEFINDKGYTDFRHWLADGWDWVNENKIISPMYWHNVNGVWFNYKLSGFEKVDPLEPVTHISFYEADAFARWCNKRLPTEFEWEVAAKIYSSDNEHTSFLEKGNFHPVASKCYGFSGEAWQWTNSAYLPYPYYKMAKGAIGEYNGKFMINQMVLKGGSCATPKDHYRHTYRNFFQPDKRWQFTGIRLAEHI